MTQPGHHLRRFGRDDTKGSVTLEAVLIMPLMLWAYMGLFVYWDAFRSINVVQKATYTVSDMISREMITLTPAYVTGMDTVVERLIDPDQNVSMRVTSVSFDEADDRNEVHWSISPGGAMPALTTATLQTFVGQIPEMADGDYVVIVESAVDYTPAFNVGITDLTMREFIVTRPRYMPRICMQGFPCS